MIGSVISKNGIYIRLTAERWSHIVEAHDYMAGNQDLVFETIENPDYIVQGEKDELIAIKHYQKTSIWYCQLFCVNLIKGQIGPHLSYRI